MEFFSVVAMAGCPTTSAKVDGRYFRADTMNFSIRDAKIATSAESGKGKGKSRAKKDEGAFDIEDRILSPECIRPVHRNMAGFFAVIQKLSTFALYFLNRF